jgi:hypothetical protein
MAPRNLAPSLYRIARFKTITIHTEMHNSNWIRNLQNIHTSVQMEEFTLLFMALSIVSLTEDKDKITWKWTANGEYSVSSAYECQILGSMARFPAANLWQSLTEPKCIFFTWKVMHDKILIAENMAKKNWHSILYVPYASV